MPIAVGQTFRVNVCTLQVVNMSN